MLRFSCVHITAFLIVATVFTFFPRRASADEAVFVKDGNIVDALTLGRWQKKENDLSGAGVRGTILFGGRKIGIGDFKITARLMMEPTGRNVVEQIEASAPIFCINNNTTRLGVDMKAKTLFVESPLFERVYGDEVKSVSDLDDRIVYGKPFELFVRREGQTLTMGIDGREDFKLDIGTQPMGLFALRPHFDRMYVYDFSASGNLIPLTEREKKEVMDVTTQGMPLHLEMTFPKGVSHQVIYRSAKQIDGFNNIRIPAIVSTKQGTLLAFAEGRTGGDAGKLGIVLRRSEDEGKTWSPLKMIWEDGDNTCGNPCPVVDESTGTVWLFGTWNYGPDVESKILDGTSKTHRIPHVMKSEDDGKTWSRAVPLPHLRKENWGWYATGPGNAIQLTRGPHRGRLVIPANHSVVSATMEKYERYRSHIILSDDHGKTWRLGAIAEPYTNESTVVERTDGSVMDNMRSYHEKGCKAVAISRDGGETFPETGILTGKPGDTAYLDHALQTPVCQANLLRYSWPENGKPGIVLFSSPHGRDRAVMTVWLSYDDGKTWPHRKIVYNGPASYSNLVALPDGRVGLLCESGPYSPYEAVTFLTFSIAWLTER